MKIAKKVISTMLVIIFLSTSLAFANNNSKASKLYTKDKQVNVIKLKKKVINNTFDINPKKIQEESEFFKSNMSYPNLSVKEKYINDKEVNEIINIINKDISTDIIDFNSRVKKESQQYKKDYEEIYSKSDKGYVKYQYETYSDYKVTYNKNNLLSIPIRTYEFLGGAHGMSYLNSYNYDLVTKKELKLKDVFKGDVNYKKIVDDFVKKEIAKNSDVYFTGKEGFNGINENQNFYIDDDGIVVYFQLYEIGPYYMGIPEFKLTYKEFGEYLNITN